MHPFSPLAPPLLQSSKHTGAKQKFNAKWPFKVIQSRVWESVERRQGTVQRSNYRKSSAEDMVRGSDGLISIDRGAGMHATAVTARQSIPAGHLSLCTIAVVTTVMRTPFRVHSTFRTC